MSLPITAVRVLDKYTLSPALFSHHSGIVGVASGKWKIQQCRRTSDVDLASGQYEDFKRDHWVDLGQPYDESLIEDIASKYRTYIEQEDHTTTLEYDGTVYNRTLRSYGDETYDGFDFGEHIPEINELLRGDIAEAMQTYYGSYFEPDYVQAYRNYHVPDEIVRETEVFSNYWHTDQEPIDFVKLFVTLSDVSEEHGPLHLTSRDDTRKIVNFSFNRTEDGVSGGVIDEKAGNLLRATGPTGSTFLANTNYLLHRAGVPEKGKHRDMLVIRLSPSQDPLPEDWLNDPSISLIREDRTPY